MRAASPLVGEKLTSSQRNTLHCGCKNWFLKDHVKVYNCNLSANEVSMLLHQHYNQEQETTSVVEICNSMTPYLNPSAESCSLLQPEHKPRLTRFMMLRSLKSTNKRTPSSKPLQVRKHSALLNIEPLLALLSLRSDFDFNPVDALHQTRLVHVRAQEAILMSFALRQTDTVDCHEDLVRATEAQCLGDCR